MYKIVTLLVIILSSVMPIPAYAQIPDNEGQVLNTAYIFSDTKVNAIHSTPSTKVDFATVVIEPTSALQQISSSTTLVKNTPAEENNNNIPTWNMTIILIFILLPLGTISLAIVLLRAQMSLRNQKNNFATEIQTIIDCINNNQGQYKEMTSKYLASDSVDFYSVGKSLKSLYSQASQLHIDLDMIRIPYFNFSSYKTRTRKMKESYAKIVDSFSTIQTEMNLLTELEEEIQESNEYIENKLSEIERTIFKLPIIELPMFNDIQKEYSTIKTEFEVIKSGFHEIEAIDSDLKLLKSRIDYITVIASRAPELYQELIHLPKRVSAFKDYVCSLLIKNNLAQHEFNPYEKIDAAKEIIYLCQQSFRNEDWESCDKHLNDITRYLRASVDEVEARISLKRQVNNDFQSAEKILSNIALSEDEFNKIYINLKERLTEKYWIHMPDRYQRYLSELHNVQVELAKIHDLISDDVQKYTEASILINTTLAKLSQIEDSFDSIKNAEYVYQDKIHAVSKQLSIWSVRLQEALDKAKEQTIQIYSTNLLTTINKSNEQKINLSHSTKKLPIDIDVIELELSQFLTNVRTIEEAIDIMIEEKKEVERKFITLQNQQNSRKYGRSGTKLPNYSTSNIQELNHLLLIGAYGDALRYISDIESKVDHTREGSDQGYNSNCSHNQSSIDSSDQNYRDDNYDYPSTSNYDSGCNTGGNDGGGSADW